MTDPPSNCRVRPGLICIGFLIFTSIAQAVSLREVVEQYSADSHLLSQHWQITGDSKAAMDREHQMLTAWLDKLHAIDFAKLKPDDRVDYVLLRNELEAAVIDLRERRSEAAELTPWLGFRTTVDRLTEARVRGEPLHAEIAAGILAPLAKTITDLQGKLKAAKEKQAAAANAKKDKAKDAPPSSESEKTAPAKKAEPAAAPKAAETKGEGKDDEAAKPNPAPKPTEAPGLPTPYQALRSAEIIETVAQSLKSWFGNYHGFLPDFSWWVKQPYDETAKALEGYGKFLREELAGVKNKDDAPLLGKVVGASSLREQLAHEFIPYTAEELIAIAEREFAWCEDRMKQAATDMKLGDDWKKALQNVKLQYVKPGEQEELVRQEGLRAIGFVKQHDLVTVPPDCQEWWATRMLNPQEQKEIPYAAYSGHDVLVAYANEGMKHEDKLMSMRGNNKPFMHNVVPHELIPGHHLQNFMAARHRPYRRIFSTPFFVEGWALYWEMRLWDLGYQTTPEDRIGALFWRMHRCARILVTLKFHLGQMTPDEMVKFLIDRVGHEKFGATSEVRRFIKGEYNPLYQCGYMLGGLQLIALHKELVVSGKMTERQFHDAILKLGPMPVELLRVSLTNIPLTADFQSQWKFDAALGPEN